MKGLGLAISGHGFNLPEAFITGGAIAEWSVIRMFSFIDKFELLQNGIDGRRWGYEAAAPPNFTGIP